MSTFWIKAIQLILSLSFLVVIHELGHFTWARIFKVRVEKFYVFFNPSISLVRWKRVNGKLQFRFFAPNTPEPMKEKIGDNGQPELDKKGNPIFVPMTKKDLDELPDDDWRKYPDNTEWGIGWLPFGGYCRIAGMVDETTSSDQLASEPQPWEYRSQSTWKRMLIISGGVMVNFIAAMLIYGGILHHFGDSVMPINKAPYGLYYSQSMQNLGFRNGDNIIALNGKTTEDYEIGDLLYDILLNGEQEAIVLRGNETVSVRIPEDYSQTFMSHQDEGSPVQFAMPFIIDSIVPDGPAYKAGLQKNDQITAVNNVPTQYAGDVRKQLALYSCDSISISFIRNDETCQTMAYVGDKGLLSVTYQNSITPIQIEYGFWEAIPAGIKLGWKTLVNYVRQFKLVFTKEGAESLGGFGAIGSLFPEVWNWYAFWSMTAFLSIILAFMNFLPIPGLDGGYFIFLIFEMITGRKPSDRFMEWTTNIGFILLLILLIYANGNDIWKAIKH